MSVALPRYPWRALSILAAFVFAYATVLTKLSHDWWTDQNYSHGLLIPFVIGYLLWADRQRLAVKPARPSVFGGGAVVLLALGTLWAGTAGAELYMQRVSMVLMLAGIIAYFWGFAFLRLTAVPLALLVLAIPIPTIIFNQIAFPMQLFASRCAVWSMRLFDIPVLRQGNVIELLPRGATEIKKLEVVEACSGIRSLMTLMTLAVLFAYLTHTAPEKGGRENTRFGYFRSYGFWRSTILIVSAVPIAILTNALRVSGTGVLAHYYGTRVADGFFHSFSGWVIYIAAALLVFALARALDLFQPAKLERLREDRVTDRTGSVAIEETASLSTGSPVRTTVPVEETK